MAALRHGIRTVIIPKANERDLGEIDPVVRRALNFVTAETVDTVLETALNHKPMVVSVPAPGISPDAKSTGRNTGIRQ